MHSTIQDPQANFRELPYNELPIFTKQQQAKEQYARAKEILKQMAKDTAYKGIVDEFKYLIETNEKYNHELIEDLEWMKKTAYSFKH